MFRVGLLTQCNEVIRHPLVKLVTASQVKLVLCALKLALFKYSYICCDVQEGKIGRAHTREDSR